MAGKPYEGQLIVEAHPFQLTEEFTALLAEARAQLRDRFLTADVGITGANFLVADSGSIVTVTNEGNAELTPAVDPAISCGRCDQCRAGRGSVERCPARFRTERR